MKQLLRVLRNAITVVLLVTVPPSPMKKDTLARIDKQLGELKTFQYERGGDPLRDLEITIFQLPARFAASRQDRGQVDQSAGSIERNWPKDHLPSAPVVGTDKCIPAIAPLLTDPN